MRAYIRPAVASLLLLTIITGIIYPLAVTGIARIAFADQARGSLINRDGKTVGSELIAQPFTDPKYFWPRPSAASYNGAGGSGSNLAPTNPALIDAVQSRIAALKAADPSNTQPVPVDLVTASASGLDPHISIAAAHYQVPRIARARSLPAAEVEKVVAQQTESRGLGILGEPRVNVLKINLALDTPQPLTMAATSPSTQSTDIILYRGRGFAPWAH